MRNINWRSVAIIFIISLASFVAGFSSTLYKVNKSLEDLGIVIKVSIGQGPIYEINEN
ncbi:hypothetical protein [Gudongella oleilytica]|jgi:hypothetical protein|uniref:hypothetical protein n=1 Tax=Gudongella oleilytica TaxID=1582259 RepID=UPI002A37149F|nr:hypothetical protein [Gudongella oleilytica]MDY0257298.1 hypothetical protein [Gudongella oleilytica]